MQFHRIINQHDFIDQTILIHKAAFLRSNVNRFVVTYKDIGGFGGPCLKNIKVKYNDTKEFELFLYKYIDIEKTDSEIITLLEKENYTNVDSRTNTPVPENPQSMFEYDWNGAYLDILLG